MKQEIKEILETIFAWIVIISICFGVITLIIVGFIQQREFVKNQFSSVTYDKCCGGVPCSDTYYSEEDNLCHLVLCENSFYAKQLNCTYKPK